MRLNRVSGDCDKVAMSFEGGGEGPEEAGGHGQEVALHTRESDEVGDDLENLIEDQHSVEPVERGFTCIPVKHIHEIGDTVRE